MTHRPRVWCSKYYSFFIISCKIETSDTHGWWVVCPSEPAYYIADCRFLKGLEGSGNVRYLGGHRGLEDLKGPVVSEVNKVTNKDQTYLQLPLQQWSGSNVYLLVLFSWKVHIAENPIAVTGLYIRSGKGGWHPNRGVCKSFIGNRSIVPFLVGTSVYISSLQVW